MYDSADPPPLSPAVLDLLPPLGAAEAAPGVLLDAAGVRTRRAFRGGPAGAPGVVHRRAPADSWEWIPLVWAVLTARERMVAVELGAGWGPWISRCHVLARRLGRPCRIYGVEAEPAHFAQMQRHMADNAIPEEDRVLRRALVAERPGLALFPVTDTPEQSWGLRQAGRAGTARAAVLAGAGAEPVEGEPGRFRLPKSPHRYRLEETVTLSDLLAEEPRIDFMHVDIQGAEERVLPAEADLLNARLRVLAVGTHSPAIEARIRDCFTANGWICHHDTGQHTRPDGRLADGHQVWRNPRLGPAPGP